MVTGPQIRANYAMADRRLLMKKDPLPPDDQQPTAPPDRSSEKMPVEINGPKGPEPTRYKDWEKGGRCIDF